MKEKENFWIEAIWDREESAEKAVNALSALEIAHEWTVNYLNAYFLGEGRMPSFIDIRPDLNEMIKKKKLWRYVQRYSLERTTEKTFPYFSDQNKFTEKGEFFPVPPQEINEIQIRSRDVWKRHLARGSGLTTSYGMIFLEGDWKKTLREQAGEIELDFFPFLWHSILVRYEETEKKWWVRFNYHLPLSKEGEKARKIMEKEYADF